MEPQTTTPTPPLISSSPPAPPISPSSPSSSSSSLLKSPAVWLGSGALLIIVLGSIFLLPKKKPSQTPSSQSLVPSPSATAPTGTVEIQEQKDANAIQVTDVDTDFTTIDTQINKL